MRDGGGPAAGAAILAGSGQILSIALVVLSGRVGG
jgi:hypothetical protein